MWLINAHNGIKERQIKPITVEDYPSIQNHLNNYYSKLEKRADKGITPYNLRNCAYMEDFYRQKIIYPGIMRIAKSNKYNFPRFAIESEKHFYFGNDCYFIVGRHLDYLWLLLNSTLLGYLFRYYIYSFDETGFKMFTDYFQNIPLPLPTIQRLQEAEEFISKEIDINAINNWVYQMMSLTDNEIEAVERSVDEILGNISYSQ